ncbi:MAG: peptide-methionine (S)-S-oxide reductase MsrA [Armatimonadetes bacterium]|nr:peptide-methionine (S)-S-oxide reductase MsrA [Armatimonadota bacterium]
MLAPQNRPSAAPRAATKQVKPAPVPQGMAVATLGGGCFWSMEAIYERLNGVKSAEPGYAGGKVANPTYKQVGSGKTGHAESLNIVYDPKVISYADLVEVLLTVLDPTTLNQQGADVGTQYRSVIFYRNANEQKIAQDVIKKVNAKGIWKAPIVTQVAQIKDFYRAEDYHLNYYDANAAAPYCVAVIAPKLVKLREKFGDKLKPQS